MIKQFKLTFEVSTPSSEYKMYRIFETESENLAKEEGENVVIELTSYTEEVGWVGFELVSVEELK